MYDVYVKINNVERKYAVSTLAPIVKEIYSEYNQSVITMDISHYVDEYGDFIYEVYIAVNN